MNTNSGIRIFYIRRCLCVFGNTYYHLTQEELYHEASRPHDRPEQAGSIPVYPPNLHPWSPGVVSVILSPIIHTYIQCIIKVV